MSSVNSWNYCVICMSGFLKETIEFYFYCTIYWVATRERWRLSHYSLLWPDAPIKALVLVFHKF